MRQRLRLNADRNIGFFATVSARALNVASFISLSGFDHHDGIRPQRIRSSCARRLGQLSCRPWWSGRRCSGRACSPPAGQRQPVKRDDFFPGQLVGGTPAHDRQHIALLDDCATLRPNAGPWASISAGWKASERRCPACRTTGDVDLRTLDWHRGAAVTALTPALSCRSCRPNAPFAELVCLSKSSVAEEYYAERSGNRWVSE